MRIEAAQLFEGIPLSCPVVPFDTENFEGVFCAPAVPNSEAQNTLTLILLFGTKMSIAVGLPNHEFPRILMSLSYSATSHED